MELAKEGGNFRGYNSTDNKSTNLYYVSSLFLGIHTQTFSRIDDILIGAEYT